VAVQVGRVEDRQRFGRCGERRCRKDSEQDTEQPTAE
jgi:hypothetical protein